MHRHLFMIMSLGIVLAACSTPGSHHGSMTRQEQVAEKGAVVMPFDLARTTHYFDDTATGGVETVTANDKADAEQAGLIRSHLAREAQLFGRGDFSDPAKIHGWDMPGLAVLSRAGDKLRVEYKDVAGGASLTYAGTDPAVVAAVHQWFAAQREDHAAHGHMHEHMHH